MTVLSWYENLPEEEIPPKRIWHDGEKISAWFKSIKQKRKGDEPDAPEGSFDDLSGDHAITARNALVSVNRIATNHDDDFSTI